MEKLLQLLNEYCELKRKPKIISYGKSLDLFINEQQVFIESEIIISKKFGFIHWLVNNNKVNRAKEVINDIQYRGHGQIENVDCYNQYDSLLMILAIQDDPIEFLVSILK